MCGYWGFAEFQNLNNRRNLLIYSQNIFIDFQGEEMLEAIPADFLRWAEKVSAGSPWDGGDKVSRS